MRTKTWFVMALAVISLIAVQLNGADAKHHDMGANAEWSKAVNGLRARVFLKRRQIVNGTPIIATYLALQNVSDVMTPLEIPLSLERMKFRVVDADGKELPVMLMVYEGGSFLSGDVHLVIPNRGELSFDMSAHGASIQGDQAAQIDLGPMQTWTIAQGEQDHFLQVTIEIEKPSRRRGSSNVAWHGRLEIPPVLIPVRPDPIDVAPSDERINELGVKLLDDDSRISEEAERALSLIDDPRVIPWYLKALEKKSYSLKMSALDKLSRFNSDEAFAGLKRGMATEGSDIGNASTKQLAASLAGGVRHNAALAIARSPHPKGKQMLLTMRDDPDYAVRLTVVQTFGRMDTQESLELLKAMTADPNESVRSEAERFLKLRSEKEQAGKQP